MKKSEKVIKGYIGKVGAENVKKLSRLRLNGNPIYPTKGKKEDWVLEEWPPKKIEIIIKIGD